MVFSSTIFLFVFLPVTLCIYYNPFFRGRKFRNIFLLIASLLFYAWGEPVNVFLMILCIVLGWKIGLKIEHEENRIKQKKWLSFGISIYIMIFFVFKYLTFVSAQLYLLAGLGKSPIKIALPIGISFFLFQLMSYLFDIYYGKAGAQNSILDTGLYISLFPQLIAGPIVRYSDIREQITDRKENYSDLSRGMIRFSYGLAKKVLLSNYLGIIADNIFPNTGSLSLVTAWIGAIAYTLQIYFDFSGYSDMAIGLGAIFGFHFPENFNYPYISGSITEFWRRWHISLSTWFRDYVYIPMGGNRVSRKRWYFNLCVVWALTGIWHGANWTFLLWGLMYYLVLLMEKAAAGRFMKIPSPIRHLYTMLVVTVGWVIFRSDSIGNAIKYIKEMFWRSNTGILDTTAIYYIDNSKWIIISAIILSTPVFKIFTDHMKKRRLYALIIVLNLIIFICSISSCVSSPYNPFIYFNF